MTADPRMADWTGPVDETYVAEQRRRAGVRPMLPVEPEQPADTMQLTRTGPSYRVEAGALRLTFRDVRTDRELTADLSVSANRRHLFRTTTTLSLATRDRLAKTASDLGRLPLDEVRRAVFAAVEAVLASEDEIGSPIDLRSASLALPAGGLHVARPMWPGGSAMVVSPGDAGKSTIARALAVTLADARRVIPTIEPVGPARPVLYVAAEDPVFAWHARSVEAICRGLDISRARIAQPIELYDARGRPLHRIARAIAERAADFGAVIIDSQQACLAQVDGGGSIRDRDSLFWQAVDQIERPVFIVAHPNRADSVRWSKGSDGRIAGSEVNRDRARMIWRAAWHDEPASSGTSYRAYTVTNVKNNHGPRERPLGFAAAWQFGHGDDPGTLRFVPTEPSRVASELSPELKATLEAWENGATSPAKIRDILSINYDTARSRLRLLRERDLIGEDAS